MSSSSGPLNEELQCSICLDVFTDPVTTPCGHNFCRTCLNKCWTNTHICFCPFCYETFSRRPDLKINTTLREVVQHFKEKLNQEESGVFCDFCDERKQKAVKSCLTCQSSYCETHLEPHLRVPHLKKHTLINAVENLEDYICQKHQRPLELFCRDDQTCVCLSHEMQTELLKMMEEQQKAAEKQAEDLIKELQQEITELKRRNTELEQLSHTDDHLHLLQVCQHLYHH
uniref:RING-type domain-containing protein n=1 Tax=Sinocyclocheilus grahami TaxID=75366 RepID=A0A672N9C0_SINGR